MPQGDESEKQIDTTSTDRYRVECKNKKSAALLVSFVTRPRTFSKSFCLFCKRQNP